jgi:muramoyltetrapeptide carboxypeptidase LdcA involved in peptidoglycan recycling
LPGHDLFNRLRLRFLKDVFLLQEIVNARSQILLGHSSSTVIENECTTKGTLPTAEAPSLTIDFFITNARCAPSQTPDPAMRDNDAD